MTETEPASTASEVAASCVSGQLGHVTDFRQGNRQATEELTWHMPGCVGAMFAEHGSPLVLKSDNGSAFKSELVG